MSPSAFRVRDWADDMPPIRNLKGHVDHLAHRVLQHLARRAKPDGSDAYPAVQTVAVRLGVDRRDVRRALELLEKAGLIIDRGESEYGTTIWHLQVDDPGPVERLNMINQERAQALAQNNAERQARHRARRRNSEEPVTNALSAVTRNGEDGVTSQRGARYVTAESPLRNAVSAPRTDPFEQPRFEQPPKDEQTLSSSAHDAALEDPDVSMINFNATDLAKQGPVKKARRSYDYSPDFLAAWEAYGRIGGKQQAFQAWKQAIKREEQGVILAAIPHYLASVSEPRYTKHFSTWLNDDGWESESARPKKGYQGRAGSDARAPEEYLDRAKVRPICKLMRNGPMPGDLAFNRAWYYHWNIAEQRDWTEEQLLGTGNTPEDVEWLMNAYLDGIDPDLYDRMKRDAGLDETDPR